MLCSVGGERLAFPHRTRKAVDAIQIANRAERTIVALKATGEDAGDSVERAFCACSAAWREGESAEVTELARCANCSFCFTASGLAGGACFVEAVEACGKGGG